jgi:hypothetical protein
MNRQSMTLGVTWESNGDESLENNVLYLEGMDAYVTVFFKDGTSVRVWADHTVEFVDQFEGVVRSETFQED